MVLSAHTFHFRAHCGTLFILGHIGAHSSFWGTLGHTFHFGAHCGTLFIHTLEKAKDDEKMDFEEALDYAVDKRKFIIYRSAK